MNHNFFQAIGLADMEKVHSAVIGWMLSEDCNAFDIKAKSNLLCLLFAEPYTNFDIINIRVEFQNLDILIKTTAREVTTYWVIENKLKSSQHDNQLERYVNELTEKAGFCEKKYCLLSLISENPVCKSAKWYSTTYGQLAGFLENAISSGNKEEKDYIIVKEYHECIVTMNAALEDFLKSPKDYPSVFLNGSKRKGEKFFTTAEGKFAGFIGDNNLETIFQKCYLGKLLQELNVEKQPQLTIYETRGTALIDYLSYNDLSFGLESHIQIQNGTFKVFLGQSKGKNENKTSFLNDWGNVLVELEEQYGDRGWHVNPPKTKPSISISKPDKDWYKMPHQEIIDKWNKTYYESRAIQNIIKKAVQGKCRKSYKE